jgi:ABC-type branched-subunit amino acid transport system ATPase component
MMKELSRALGTKPKLLLLDEVIDGGNPKVQGDIVELVHNSARGAECFAGFRELVRDATVRSLG